MQIGTSPTGVQIQTTTQTNSSHACEVDIETEESSISGKTISQQIDDISKAYKNGEIDADEAIKQLTQLGATDIVKTSVEGTETITFVLNNKTFEFNKTVETSGLKELWGKVKNAGKKILNWIQTPVGLSTVVYGGISILETICPVLGKVAFAAVSYLFGDFGISQQEG